ncbi:ketoacyl-ACP synthase III family protein [Streptomyces heilongjiangensis]|uniref:Ketoacyl-ACP synthase III family protein n=1 Tax=Streptomyces heilongjiangensis TaxID=945052 RepID=A0ABW1BIC1_9ACTN|nr:ketoacyl-ACP synthase III family protein [Streptomyces heilongjiangensis]MDC2951817.1 ketoacyl-ACP synthase III family protein [Streptomyces heilongjiangensis]
MKTDGIYVDTVGAYIPEQWVSVEQAVEEGLYDEYSVQYGTGLTAAYIAGDLPALDMAVAAARHAFRRSDADIDDLDFHVHCTAVQHGPEGFYPPGYVLRELGAVGVASTDVRQHSNGLLAGIEIAVGQLSGAARAETALVTAAENFTSPLIDRWTGFGTGFTASDGGAAVLLSAHSGFAALRALNSGTAPELEQWHRGAESLLPFRDEERKASGTMELLSYFNQHVMPLDKCMEIMRDFELDIVHRSLVDAELNASDLRWVIAANSDSRMIDQMKMQPLGLPMSRSTWDFGKEYGHMGACDMAVSLNHLMLDGLVEPGDHVLMTTSASGWVSTSAVLTILDIPDWAREETAPRPAR